MNTHGITSSEALYTVKKKFVPFLYVTVLVGKHSVFILYENKLFMRSGIRRSTKKKRSMWFNEFDRLKYIIVHHKK